MALACSLASITGPSQKQKAYDCNKSTESSSVKATNNYSAKLIFSNRLSTIAASSQVDKILTTKEKLKRWIEAQSLPMAWRNAERSLGGATRRLKTCSTIQAEAGLDRQSRIPWHRQQFAQQARIGDIHTHGGIEALHQTANELALGIGEVYLTG